MGERAIAAGMEKVRAECGKYDAECIFNVDETGLFYKILQRQTFLVPTENRKTTWGVKGMSAKERITLYVCTNATGVKVPLVAIGSSKDPRCFRVRKPPFLYIQQAKAWSDGRTMKLWWNFFLRWVRNFTRKPCLLLMDNHSSHADLVDPQGNVRVTEYPPNCTAKHQPMDRGIIAATKKITKTRYLAARVAMMEAVPKLHE